MFRSRVRLFGAFLAISFRAALAQTTHNVTVGVAGSFYDPPTLSAGINDTVNFIFFGPAHSVVQASFDNPCFPLPGGFNSGPVKRPNDSSPPPIWSLRITNDTGGIWFYCQLTVPLPHCAQGMVGAINPPSQAAFQQFSDNAKLTPVSPPQGSLALTGQGAFATNSAVVPTPVSAPAMITSATSNTSSATTTTPTSAPPSKNKNGAVIGGSVVGGVVGLSLLALLGYILCRRRKNRERRGSKDFFRYKAQTPTLGGVNESFLPSKLVSPPTDQSRATQLPASTYSSPSKYSSPSSMPSALAPQRLPPAAQPANISSAASPSNKNTTNSPPSRRLPPIVTAPPPPPPASVVAAPKPLPPPPPSSPLVDQKSPAPEREGASPNIHVLAREVAAVLMQNPQTTGAQQTGRAVRTSSSMNSMNRTESPAPPRYRASVL
ncbi:hypothetical protein FPV67DRAFT_195606 [Lyophyllum atratum]|nr:hypothetical protein FPV67DRAFT_195606 [Lyophyllum atratum]